MYLWLFAKNFRRNIKNSTSAATPEKLFIILRQTFYRKLPFQKSNKEKTSFKKSC